MNEQQSPPGGMSASVELVTFLRILWHHRKVLVGTMLGGMILAGIASYLIDYTYRAGAQIVVEVPLRRQESLIFGEPLSVIAYDRMLNVDSSFRRVLDQLKLFRKLVRDMQIKHDLETIEQTAASQLWSKLHNWEKVWKYQVPDETWAILSRMSLKDLEGLVQFESEDLEEIEFEAFKRKFSSMTAIEKETGVLIEYSPIIDLDAKSNSPEKAALFTNLWAESFVSHMRERISKKNKEIVEEILATNKNTREQLNDAIQKLEEFRKSKRLDDLKKELKSLQVMLYGITTQAMEETNVEKKVKTRTEQDQTSSEFSDALLPQQSRLQKEIQTAEEQLLRLAIFLGAQEVEGTWIGNLPLQSLEAEILSTSEALSLREVSVAAEESRQSFASLRALRDQQQLELASVRNKIREIRAQGDLADATAVATLPTLQEQQKTLEENIDRTEKDVQRRNRERLEVGAWQESLSVLQTRLRYQILLEEPGDQGTPPLPAEWIKSEIDHLNQLLVKAQSRLLDLRADSPPNSGVANTPAIENLTNQVNAWNQEKMELQENLMGTKALNQFGTEEMEDASAAFQGMRRKYQESKQKQSQLHSLLQEKLSARESLETQIKKVRADIQRLTEQFRNAEAERKYLEKDQNTLEMTIEEFAPQVSEAMSEQGREVVDVRVESYAVAPDLRIAPNRYLWVGTVGSLVFVLNLIYLILRRLFELAPEA